MLRRTKIEDWQKVSSDDFNSFADYPRFSLDRLLQDLGPGFAFSGFPVVASGPGSVMVGPGRLYTLDGPSYYLADTPGVAVDFMGSLPTVARRIAAITVWGQENDTAVAPREFVTDPNTMATIARAVTTEVRRHVNVAAAYGDETPDPRRPNVPANVLVVAWVLLSPEGIVAIAANTEARAESILNLGRRANDVDTWRGRAGTRLDTLGSDLANLGARQRGLARLEFALDLARDVARLKEQASLSDDYTAWSTDHFLTAEHSDTVHVDYLARVEEGIRFPPAAQRQAQIALLNQFDAAATVQNNFLLPKHSEMTRVSVVGKEAELSIAQYAFQTITYKQMAKTRLRIRFGTPFFWCTNASYWYDNGASGARSFDLTYDPIKNIFIREATGETFQILDGGYTDAPQHTVYRLQQFWTDEIVDSYYMDRVVTTEGLNGSVVGQTFLVSQGGWLTSVDLYFTRVAAEGDVHVLICETVNGAPAFNRVVARTTLAAADLRTWPGVTKARFVPLYLSAAVEGSLYAIVLQTAGNHFVALVVNNKFAQGSLFHSSDGQWAQGDLTRDLSFQLNFATFEATRIAVQLTPLELENGIAAIDINVDSTRPAACQTTFEVQVNGVWTPLEDYEINPLAGLPPLLPLRVVLTGTTDAMPGIGIGPNGQCETWRPRSDFRHISTVQTLPAPCTTVYLDVRLEQWRGEPHHTFAARLLTGAGHATILTPDSVEDRPDGRDPFAIVKRYTFLPTDPISDFRVRLEGTTDNVLACYHVAERVQVSLTPIP